MGKTTQAKDTLYLEQEKFDLLRQLADDTRIPRAELLREAVDDLLVKHKVLRAAKGKPKKAAPAGVLDRRNA